MANYFSSNKITVYPTAYRQYVDGNGDTIQVNPEARFGTEYNTTHLVDGLLDHNINGGNFVVNWDTSTRLLQFCMQGYYFNLDLSNDTGVTNLYVKIKVAQTIQGDPDWKYMYELVPTNYSGESSSRNLDDGTNFIGLEYVTTMTAGYFPLLVSGLVPESSKLKFSTSDIGYLDNGTWVAIKTKFETNDLKVNNNIATGTINNLTLTKKAVGFEISGGTTSKKLDLTANMTNSGTFNNSNTFTNSNSFNNTASFSNSASFTNSGVFNNTATTTINKNLTIGANSTYIGAVEIKSKNNLSIQGDTTANSNVIFKGSSTFQSGDYGSVATIGSESVKVSGYNFNIVTRDTDQTISGQKTFSSDVIISSATSPSTNTQGALKVAGGINTCLNNGEYLLALGNFGQSRYGLKFGSSNILPMLIEFDRSADTLDLHNSGVRLRLNSTKTHATSNISGTLSVDGSISSNYRCYFTGLTLVDDYITLNNHHLSLANNLRTEPGDSEPAAPISLRTKCGKSLNIIGNGSISFTGSCSFNKGAYYSDATVGNEYIVVASNRFNVLTRDTQQTISSHKTLGSSYVLYLGTHNGNYSIGGNGVINAYSLVTRNGDIRVYDSGNNTKFLANTSGNVFANIFYGNYYSSSDKRLKENIKPFNNHNSILDLPIYTFDYIDGKKNNIGCMAQDLQKLYPELVDEDDKGYLNIAENKLVYLLMDEVKKLKKEIYEIKQSM